MSEASQRFLPTLNPNSLRYLVPRHDKTKRLSKYIEHLSFQNFNIFQRLFFAINKTVTTIMKASEKAAPSLITNNTKQVLHPSFQQSNEFLIYHTTCVRWPDKWAEPFICPWSFCFFFYQEKKKGKKIEWVLSLQLHLFEMPRSSAWQNEKYYSTIEPVCRSTDTKTATAIINQIRMHRITILCYSWLTNPHLSKLIPLVPQ